jgi:D-3-phosphoglycerate dehydrogenase / 2-oxoglutarate reductase
MFKVLAGSRSFGKYVDDGIRLLQENECEIVPNPFDRYLTEDDFVEILPGLDAAIVGEDEVTDRALSTADRLQIISKHGVGLDSIDVSAATRRGIWVTNVPAVGLEAAAVADLAFGLILSIARRIPQADRRVKGGEWKKDIGSDVGEKTLGVIGTGNIGKVVIRRAKGFDMEVIAHDLTKDDVFEKQYGIRYVSLEELLRQSDFVTVHVPLTQATRGMIGAREFDMMKRSAYFVNVARGGIVDQEALCQVLERKRIAGAALDVLSEEPPQSGDPLLSLDNVVITPHLGVYTPGSLSEMDRVTAQNIVNVLKGEEPLYPVNRPRKSRD